MKVLIAGAFCAGKTTLATDLKAQLKESLLVVDPCRELLDSFGKVPWHMRELRDYILVRQLFVERCAASSAHVVIVDGGVVSNLAHDIALNPAPLDRTEILDALRHEPYDLVLLCDHSEISILDDGQRFTDESLREQVNGGVVAALHQLGHREFVFVRGSREDRLAIACETISNALKYDNK